MKVALRRDLLWVGVTTLAAWGLGVAGQWQEKLSGVLDSKRE